MRQGLLVLLLRLLVLLFVQFYLGFGDLVRLLQVLLSLGRSRVEVVRLHFTLDCVPNLLSHIEVLLGFMCFVSLGNSLILLDGLILLSLVSLVLLIFDHVLSPFLLRAVRCSHIFRLGLLELLVDSVVAVDIVAVCLFDCSSCLGLDSLRLNLLFLLDLEEALLHGFLGVLETVVVHARLQQELLLRLCADLVVKRLFLNALSFVLCNLLRLFLVIIAHDFALAIHVVQGLFSQLRHSRRRRIVIIVDRSTRSGHLKYAICQLLNRAALTTAISLT